jgi:hypothetical protein
MNKIAPLVPVLLVTLTATPAAAQRVVEADPETDRTVLAQLKSKPAAKPVDVRVVPGEAGRNVLTIRNRTPFVVFIYVRGIRSGWLRGYATGLIRGLKVGYHNVYAHSRWGNAYWGPRLVWVPSRWTLWR